ncbi:MAG: NAD(P)(+) transhydrogenase (Re/Si-specific) subunit beta [Gammaproteobacteria bacterium]|nr:MAG: NAD(P)(+) transhydrogenase (Re/Si-specific) subunit beta [Gammaproteobacteria bacterium]
MQTIYTVYFVTAVLFILGLKRMAHPGTARSGIVWAGAAMALATIATFFYPNMHNYGLMILGIMIGSVVAWVSGKRVQMTAMPQMVAIYNGMGGGAAAAIAAVELSKGSIEGQGLIALSVFGGIIGSVAFSGSMIAFSKLQGIIGGRPIVFPAQKAANLIVFAIAVLAGLGVITDPSSSSMIVTFFVMSLIFGVMMTLPIGGADMPVVISLYNAFTGLAVGFEGLVMGNAAMIVAGTVVGAAGSMLTMLMAKAMNRSIGNVLFSNFGQLSDSGTDGIEGELKPIEAEDSAIMMGYAERVIIVPGYGMALAQAQHKVRELVDVLEARGVDVKFAIHPVAGRMPGHMNVLLAEAGIDYEKLYDMEDINDEFANTDVTVVMGANDVVNPAAKNNPSSPLYGMPILNVDESKNVIVIKRGQGTGFAGVENELFYQDNTRMLYGDAQSAVAKLVQTLKEM